MIAAEISAADGSNVLAAVFFVCGLAMTAGLCLGAIADRSASRRRNKPEDEQ